VAVQEPLQVVRVEQGGNGDQRRRPRSPAALPELGGDPRKPKRPVQRIFIGGGDELAARHSAARAASSPRGWRAPRAGGGARRSPWPAPGRHALSGGVTMIWAVVPPTNRSVTCRSSCPANSCTPDLPEARENLGGGHLGHQHDDESFTTRSRRRTSPAAVALRTPGTRPSASPAFAPRRRRGGPGGRRWPGEEGDALADVVGGLLAEPRQSGEPAVGGGGSSSGRDSMPSVSWIWRILASRGPRWRASQRGLGAPGPATPRGAPSVRGREFVDHFDAGWADALRAASEPSSSAREGCRGARRRPWRRCERSARGRRSRPAAP